MPLRGALSHAQLTFLADPQSAHRNFMDSLSLLSVSLNPVARDVALILAGLSLTYYFAAGSKTRRLPPSLRGWPVLGNALDIPVRNPGQNYERMAKKLSESLLFPGLP